jgi:hypothetical protein
MTRQTVKTILSFVLALACVGTPGVAQAQATTATQAPADQDQSAAAMAQEATNPSSSRWLLQTQQNNNWTDSPLDQGSKMQSNLLFQPLMSVELTKDWGLYLRPVVTIVNSLPHLDQNGHSDRSAGIGDAALGIAAAHPFFGGRLVVGAGPTFIFPTASHDVLGQDAWQVGPDVGPHCWASTSSPTASCSNGSRSAGMVQTRTR